MKAIASNGPRATAVRLRLTIALPLLLTWRAAVASDLAEQLEQGTEQAVSEPGEPGPASDSITVTGRFDERQNSTVAKISVDAEEIKKFGDTSLTDVMKRLPSVTVGATGVSLRGLGSGYTQILVDGEKMPPGFSIDSIPPESIERIEINRSASAEMSSQAIAGTINIVRKKASRKPLTVLTLGWATQRGKQEPSLNWQRTGGNDDVAFQLNALLRRRNFLVTQDETQSGVGVNNEAILARVGGWEVDGQIDTFSTTPSLTLNISDDNTLKLDGYVNIQHDVRDTDINLRTLLGENVPYARTEQKVDYLNYDTRIGAEWTREFSNGAEFEASASFIWNGREGDFEELGFSQDEELRLDNTVDSKITEHGLNTKGKYAFPGATSHTLSLGWDGNLLRRDENRLERFAALAGRPERRSDMEFDAGIDRFALYVQDEWEVTPRLSLYLGLRGEQVVTRSSGNTFSTVKNKTRVLSPILQTLWKLPGAGGQQLRFAVNRTYRPPQISSLIPRPYTTANNTVFDPDLLGNPDLRAELAWGAELGYERFWGRDTMVSVNFYVRNVDNVIRNELVLNGDRWLSFPLNDGKARVWGIETEAKTVLSALIEGAPKISVRFNMTANWSDVENVSGPNNRIEDQVPFSGTLSADYPIHKDLTIGGSFSWKEGTAIRTSDHLTSIVSKRRELDFYALWSVTDKAKLRLSGTNLLHKDVIGGMRYSSGDSDFVRRTVRVSPVTARVTLEAQF